MAAVVGDEIVAAHGGQDVAPADDGHAVRMDAVGGFPRQAAQNAAGIVFAHVHFAQDDFPLAGPFVFGERRMEDGIAEHVEADEPACGGQGGVEDGAVGGGVGIDFAARVGDLLRDLGRPARGRALEDHVFEVVRQSAAEMFRFVDGAGADPELEGDHGCAAVFLEQDDQAVVQNEAADAGIGGFQDVDGILGHGMLRGGEKGGDEADPLEPTIHGP